MKTKQSSTQLGALGLAISALAITGCSSTSDEATLLGTAGAGTGNDSDEFNQVQIDASSYTATTYFNILTGQTVELSDEEAASSSAWHIGFKRTGLKLNGGDSGPGNVAGAVADTQEGFYTAGEANASVFLNADADIEAAGLSAAYDLGSLTFSNDTLQAAIEGSGTTVGTSQDNGWFNYNFVSHEISLNSDNWWLIKSNTGLSYAKFHATSVSYTSGVGLDVTFEFDVQAENTVQFVEAAANFSASIPVAGGSECFDFDSNAEVDCNSTDWDIKIESAGRSWALWTNGGDSGNGSGGAFGPFTTAEADAYTAGHVAPDGITSIARHYSSDASAGIFSENDWYAYNLEGAHKLWPNFRTYIIDTDTTDANSIKYAFQVVNYYSAAAVSGNPTIRFVEATEAE